MTKYKLQEMPDVHNTGKRRVYLKIVTNRTLSRKEFIKRMQGYHRGISESTTEAVLLDVADMLVEMLSMGYNVNLEGIGTFSLSLGFEDDKPTEMQSADDKMTYRKVGVKDMKTGKTVYLKAGDPTDRYFTNLAWAPDGKKVYMFELNRDQNDCRLTAYDAETGEKTGELYREVDEKYVEPLNPIVFLPWDKSQFIMQSRQDGYNHLYLCTLGMHGSRMASNTESLEVEQLTEGKWEVLSVLGFNSKTKSIIYKSNEASPIQQNVYSVSVANKKRTRIDEGGKGWHEGSTISASGRYLLDNYQEPTVPRRIVAIDTQTGKSHCILNAKDPWKEKGYNIPEYSCGKLKAADGTTDLYWRMVKPVDFDPNKKYPTVVYVQTRNSSF